MWRASRPTAAAGVLLLLQSCLAGAQLQLKDLAQELQKVEKAVKDVASQSDVQKAAKELQKSSEKPLQEAIDGVAKNKNLSKALIAADGKDIAEVVKKAAGTLQKGAEAINGTGGHDFESALRHVAGNKASSGLFNLSGSELLNRLRSAVPQAQQALHEVLSPEGSDAPTIERVERVVEKVKEVSKTHPVPVFIWMACFAGICGFCAFYNLKLRQSPARSPSLQYGLQLQSNVEEPFFRQF